MSLSYESNSKEMVIGQAMNAYNELTDEQKHIIDRKYIQGTHTATEWLEVLKGIAEYDALGDDAKKVAKPSNAGCVVVAVGIIGAILLANVAEASEQSVVAFLGIALLFGVGLMIYRTFKPTAHRLLEQRDLPNHFRSFALPILVLLKEEIAADEPIEFWVDMRNKNQSENIIQKQEARPRSDTQTTFFRHNMVEIKTRFVDGTRFYFQLGDVVRMRVRRRRNPRGKLKVKTKYKIKTQWNLKIALPKKHYILEKRTREVDDTDPKRIVFKAQQVEIRTIYNYVPNVNFFMKMVLGIYKKVQRV
ncbi:MAG TPA: hypothetical protein DCS93_31560 [Microscillaceae bacterium]|nr:hypothetical protein [Microscillaceae bacterium]